jgi:predicted chitinase
MTVSEKKEDPQQDFNIDIPEFMLRRQARPVSVPDYRERPSVADNRRQIRDSQRPPSRNTPADGRRGAPISNERRPVRGTQHPISVQNDPMDYRRRPAEQNNRQPVQADPPPYSQNRPPVRRKLRRKRGSFKRKLVLVAALLVLAAGSYLFRISTYNPVVDTAHANVSFDTSYKLPSDDVIDIAEEPNMLGDNSSYQENNEMFAINNPTISVSAEHLQGIWRQSAINTPGLIDGLNAVARDLGLDATPEGLAHFWSQITVESAAHAGIFRSSMIEGEWAGHNAERHFTHVSGGAKYRGIGPIQMTHDYNYESFMKWWEKTTGEKRPRIMSEGHAYVGKHHELMFGSVQWFLSAERPRWIEYASNGGSVVEVTRQIQGGSRGLDERTQFYNQFLDIFEPMFTSGQLSNASLRTANVSPRNNNDGFR